MYCCDIAEPDVYEERHVRARREHGCTGCGRAMPVGYRHLVGKM